MPAARIVLCNRTSHPLHFHVEPECTSVELPSGKALEISGVYASEPISIQYSDDAEFGIFGAIFPGDGSVSVIVDGQNQIQG